MKIKCLFGMHKWMIGWKIFGFTHRANVITGETESLWECEYCTATKYSPALTKEETLKIWKEQKRKPVTKKETKEIMTYLNDEMERLELK